MSSQSDRPPSAEEKLVHEFELHQKKYMDDVDALFAKENQPRGTVAFKVWEQRFISFLEQRAPSLHQIYIDTVPKRLKNKFFGESVHQNWKVSKGEAIEAVLTQGIEDARAGRYVDEEKLEGSDKNKESIKYPSVKIFEKIFISHSSKDSEIVAELIDIIEDMSIKSSQIYCSSFPGYGTPLGSDFLETIKNEITKNVLVLFVLSENFYSSPISLCEMGATWVLSKEHILVVVPPFTFEDIKGVFPQTQGLLINDKLALNSLQEKIVNMFQLTPQPMSTWERKRDRAITRINAKLIKELPSVSSNESSVNKPVESVDSATSSIPNLTEEAKKLLLEAVKDKNGSILKVRSHSGLSVQTGNVNFADKGNPRSEAMWENAVELLVNEALIADRGYKGEVFRVTADGYQVADYLSSST